MNTIRFTGVNPFRVLGAGSTEEALAAVKTMTGDGEVAEIVSESSTPEGGIELIGGIFRGKKKQQLQSGNPTEIAAAHAKLTKKRQKQKGVFTFWC